MTVAGPRHVKGVCPLDCQDSCGWIAEVENGRVARVRGDREHPFTRGVLCTKVRDYEARTYAPDRLLHPMRRVGPKGEGRFERIGWSEAIDTIATRFEEIVRRHGAQALMPMCYLGSMGMVQRLALLRLFHALGATRFHGDVCGAATNALIAAGHPIGFDPEDIVDSRFVLLWGANILTTCHHHWHFIQEAKRRHGARIVAIDPRRTRTAAAADEHISIRPGTDAILAAALAYTILEEGLADLAFAESVASDLDAFRADVAAWDAARAGRACGVPAADIRRLARELAAARPGTIRCGIGPQQTASGETFVRAVSALSIVCGHARHKGGGLFIMAFPPMNEAAVTRPDLSSGTPRSLDVAQLARHLTDKTLDPPIAGLTVWCANPAVTQTDGARMQQGLAREDLFLVVLENFLTDTARYADILLPSTTQLEHLDVQGAWGHHYVAANNPAIAPLGEARTHGDVMRQLAARLGLNHPALQESDEAIAAAGLPEGIGLDALRTRGAVKCQVARAVPGAAGKVALSPGVAEMRPPPAGRLQLLTPKAHHFLNSSFANMPRQRQAESLPTLDMHPDDARCRGLADGVPVTVANERGSVRAALRITAAIRAGVVALPGKWWSQPAETGAVTNLLAPAAWTPIGQPTFNDIFVEVGAAS